MEVSLKGTERKTENLVIAFGRQQCEMCRKLLLFHTTSTIAKSKIAPGPNSQKYGLYKVCFMLYNCDAVDNV